MNIEEFRDHCLLIKGSTESMPFPKHNILAFKVMDKMFAYIPLSPEDGVFRANLKYSHVISLKVFQNDGKNTDKILLKIKILSKNQVRRSY